MQAHVRFVWVHSSLVALMRSRFTICRDTLTHCFFFCALPHSLDDPNIIQFGAMKPRVIPSNDAVDFIYFVPDEQGDVVEMCLRVPADFPVSPARLNGQIVQGRQPRSPVDLCHALQVCTQSVLVTSAEADTEPQKIQSAPARTGDDGGGDQYKSAECCRAWNKGRTCKRMPCPYTHTCSTCGGDHRAKACNHMDM